MEPNKTSSGKISQIEENQDDLSAIEKLIEKAAQNLHNKDIRVEIQENDKISEALTDFIEPYIEDEYDEDLEMVLDLATFAWNLSFFSKKVAQKEIECMFQDADTDPEGREELKQIIGQMVARKKRRFSKYKRLIIDYELREDDDGFYLSVISTSTK
ncbi:MAG: hypothetical protein AAGA80_02025 [Cyanobacteria bacterium P01_F01_bin.143]